MDCQILHREELLKLSDYFMVLPKTIIQKMGKLHLELVKPIHALLNASKVFISLSSIDFKGIRCNSPRKSGIRFKNQGTKKEVENDLLSFVAPLTVGSCNLICKSLV
jgi:hypothetical protein